MNISRVNKHVSLNRHTEETPIIPCTADRHPAGVGRRTQGQGQQGPPVPPGNPRGPRPLSPLGPPDHRGPDPHTCSHHHQYIHAQKAPRVQRRLGHQVNDLQIQERLSTNSLNVRIQVRPRQTVVEKREYHYYYSQRSERKGKRQREGKRKM